MSRQISCRYLLFYLSVSVILTCGSFRRIRKEACPSCSLDCPEALTVQLPWNPHQESNLLQNSPYSRLSRGEISQNIARDDVSLHKKKNLMSFGNYRRFHQQEPVNQDLFVKNYFNSSPQSSDRQEIFSQDVPMRGYSHIVPSRQIFEENWFFRNPHNKYSESLLEDYKRMKDYKMDKEDPMRKVLMQRADRDTKSSGKYSEDTSSNVMQLEKPFSKVENIYRLRREDILDEEKDIIKESSNSASQLRYSPERYSPVGFGLSEVKNDPYVKDTDISKSTKKFFDNWDIAKNSQSSNSKQFRNNFLELYPARKQEIIAKDDNEQINSNSHNSKFPQDINIWKSRKDEELFDSLMKANTKPFENEEDDKDMKEYFEGETEYFMDDKDMKEYFEDETEHNTIKTGRNNINPHMFPPNIWKGIENEEFDDLNFIRENSQETGQLGLYSEENNKYFQNEQDEDLIFRDKAYTSTETARTPVINAYNAYILPRYLNIVNDKKYPTKSETQELSETKNSIHANPVKEMNHRFFEDEAVVKDNIMSIKDLIHPKNIFNIKKYNNPIANKWNKNEVLTELDPDILDDIENPPVETTESALT
ncbi:uncharacterized protein [Mycetomoellerius zeteki]|uniref:uncharacterized protein n=1 Tax=Mycetomoellerius zeteki TaxID=64791 RepID=UPI00084E537D|nr:PREDICTED: uncharacterized protein LOC108731530 [Trachymyrmex zeteki]